MQLKRTRRAIALAGVACAAVLLNAPAAKAITLTVSTSLLAGNSANLTDNSPPVQEIRSAVSTPDTGGSAGDTIGAVIDGVGRYVAENSADSDAANFASISTNQTSTYRVSVTVNATYSGETYDLQIDTKRLGALVVRNEGGSAGIADISAVTGTINGVGNAGLGLADIAGLNTNSTAVTQINQNNTVTISGVGSQVFNLDFIWTANTSSGNNVLSGGDEGAVMLGLAGTISNVAAADDYPGTSGRTNGLAEDGHWTTVTLTVTAVPEPSTLALAGIGLAVGGLAAWRRRRAA